MCVLRLREDHEELVVREEEEAREGEALRLEVVVEALLDRVELPVGVGEAREEVLDVGDVEDVGVLQHQVHRLAPERVHLLEALGLVFIYIYI